MYPTQACVVLIISAFSVQSVFSLKYLFPIVDLNYIRDFCEDVEGININETIAQVGVCLQNIPNNLQAVAVEDNTTYDIGNGMLTSETIECKYSATYLDCYNIASQTLNKCDGGRGDVLQEIQSTFHSQYCASDGSSLKDTFHESDGQQCEPKYETEECNSENAFNNWESKDICTSFKALLDCQESVLLSSNCIRLKLTRLIIQKLRATQVVLGCLEEPTLFMFPTPRDELLRIKSECERKGIQGIHDSMAEARKCFEQLNINREEVSNQCEIVQIRNGCSKPIEAKIDECIHERGSTVGRIYSEMLKVTCADKEKLKSLAPQKCAPHKSVEACKNEDEMNSSNLCTSFKSTKKCIEDSIASCNNLEHRRLVTSHLKQVDESLHCNQLMNSNSNRVSGATILTVSSAMFTLFCNLCIALFG